VKSWIEVSEERLAENFRTVAQAAGAQADVLAVVKANAYGHGAETCSVTLARAGAKWLGVTDAGEGARVRKALDVADFAREAGHTPRILVMCGSVAEDVAAIVEHGLTPVLWTKQQVGWLAGYPGMRVHVEVDTGMARQGVLPGAALDELLDAMSDVQVELDGIFTHFCAAEVAHSELTRRQRKRFEAAVAQLRERGLRPGWVHAGSSSYLDNPPQFTASEKPPGALEKPLEASQWLVELAHSVGARAMVRCGIALYGYCLPIEPAWSRTWEHDAGVAQPKVRTQLRPVMQWKTRILDVREIAAGETVGYNATFTAPGPMRLALLPVGYADGLRRELSSTNTRPGGWAIVRGRPASILGRISMNLTMVDVTAIAGARVGDEVVLLGDGVTADDHARLARTIPYEILCGIRAG
jgi:alanine racemase